MFGTWINCGVASILAHPVFPPQAAAVEVVDSSLCSGLDQLVTAVPSLAAPTPSLLTSATAAANTLASFTLGQLALKAADSGLETAGGLLKLGPAGKVEAAVEGLARARGEVATIRREGAKIDGSEKVGSWKLS